jgi:murein DD-endopeptidase MepM/ murein hydrolase activator NlpD
MRLLSLVFTLFLVAGPSALAGSWQRPLDGAVLRPFAVSADRFARGQHRGVDLAAPPGATVRAVCAGRVRFAGSVPGGGQTVSIGCGRLVATYQHLAVPLVRRGQALLAGASVGTVGRSGLAPGDRAHLHLGARELASGRYVDPLGLFRTRPRVLPPVAVAPRRGPVPLGPAPRPAIAPAPLDAAPARVPAPAIALQPRGRVPAPVIAPAAPVPPAVWIGLAAFGLGLPLAPLTRLRRRRRGRQTTGARARRWAAAHR